jgi:hypothetical protein
MAPGVDLQLLYRVGNAPIRLFPFPHIFVREVFAPDFYRRLREHIPPREAFSTLKDLERVYGDYPESRLVFPLTPEAVNALAEPFRSFWYELGGWLLTGEFVPLVLSKFETFLDERFAQAGEQELKGEALLVQDHTTYALPPHTDSPRKVMSFLFYLPEDESMSHLGTSIYVPKDRQRVSEGGDYCKAEDFDRLMTMPYLPNSLFAFVKTPSAFHGVEAIADRDIRRDLLLFDIKITGPLPDTAVAPPVASGTVQFTF